MHRNRRKRKLVIFSLIFVLLLMVTGYASFKSSLNIKGSSKVTSNWDVRITNIAKGTFNGSAEEATEDGVKVDPTCSESGTPKTCDTGLKASISVDLYEAGDSAEYDITISNKGDIDAKLDDILIDNTNSNSAVLITYSGYSKGERLFKNGTPGNSKTIHVKVAYNPEYSGGEVSSEIDLTFEFVQASDGDIEPTDTYTLTYDYQTNGGTKANETANYDVGENVDLISHTDSRQGYSFVGWNTDSSATTALPTYTMPNSNATLYAIYEQLDNTPPVIDSIGTTKTSSRITAVVTAHDDETNITKYEFSIDGGEHWIDNGNNNVYTFTGLTNNQAYTVDVRVTNSAGLNSSDNTSVTTGLDVPTFVEIISTEKTDVEITYPVGCGSILTCTYQKNSEEEVTLTSDMLTDNKYKVEFTDSGTVIAKVTEGANFVSSSYTVDFTPNMVSSTDDYGTSGYTTFTAPTTGDYYLQVWGAQGGTYSGKAGGKGGYSYGTVTLNEGDILYIYTGGQGSVGTSSGTGNGGFNGGGTSYQNSAGGGGASDIRINSDSLYARVIVAGGGGGSGQDGCATAVTGYGGGTSGGGGTNQSSCGTQGGGGTQTSGGSAGIYSGTNGTAGSFGQGGNALSGSYKGGGGGGGWYGGGSGASAGWSNGAGGGSGYVYTEATATNYPSGCLLNSGYYLKNAATIAGDGSESFESPSGGTESGHTGNGYVKITYDINVPNNERLELTSSNVTTNSMTIIATLDSNIIASKYEFSIDNGETWIDNGTSNIYTPTNLNHNTTYHIKSRVTTPDGKVIAWVDEKTNEITEPTFVQTNVGLSDDVLITYPEECGTTLTCTYKKDNDSEVVISTTQVTVNFAESGTVIAKVTDGSNVISVSHSVIIPERYLITYDCSENGGTGDTIIGTEANTNADLTPTCSKDEYDFVGWNTNKDATEGLNTVVANSTKTLYGIYSKTINVTYTRENRISTLSKYSDSCTVYNKNTSCSFELPDTEINEPYYDTFDGYYIGNTKIGDIEDNYTLNSSTTVKAKAKSISMIKNWVASSSTDFHSSMYKSRIISVEFLETNVVPSEAIASWDVSAVQNSGKVMAWIIPDANDNIKYHLYIGGDGGVYANQNSSYLFYKFSNLISIDGSKLNTSKVTNMVSLFEECSNLTTLDISDWDTSNVTDMNNMFRSCINLTTLDLSNFDTSNVTNMQYMFYNCSSLNTLDVSSFDTSNVTSMHSMFSGCTSLTTLDVSNFDTSKVTDMKNMFSGCSGLTLLDVSDWDTSKVTTMYSMFEECSSLTTLDVSDWNTSKVTEMSWIFNNSESLTTLDVSKWDTSNVNNMMYMFSGCTSLTTLDVSNFDTSKVTDMGNMFRSCSNLTTLDLSKWDTSNVNNMMYMFYGCSGLTSLDVSSFDTSKVTDMKNMFYGCSGITLLDVSSFDTSNVTNMESMFYNCSSLTTLDLSSFDTSNVASMGKGTGSLTGGMFAHCTSLITIDLSSFDTNQVMNMKEMFLDCPNLVTIYTSYLFDVSNVTTSTDMFFGCTSLIGGDGTFYDSTKKDKTYARIGRDGFPGYFTDGKSPVISNIGTYTTTDSVTATVNAIMPVQGDIITKYEFSFDGGAYVDNSTNNIYTFTGLTSGQQYKIKVRVTGSTGKTTEKEIVIQGPTSIDVPTYVEGLNKVTVIYPSGCGNTFTCTYKKNNDAEVTVTDRNVDVSISEASGTIVGTITDGTVNVSSSYTYTVESIMKTWDSGASTDFHNSTYKSKITSVEFLDTINVPSGATSWDVSSHGNGSVMAYVLDDGNSGYELYIAGNGSVKAYSTSYLFSSFSKLASVDFDKLDTSQVKNMKFMFYGCSQLTTIDISDFDTSNVTNMFRMFSDCSSLTTLDISNWNTGQVKDMQYMFSNCSKLTTLDISDWDTSNVTHMRDMFFCCKSLTTLDISDWNTGNVINMKYMFYSCSSLTTLDISDWNTGNVIDMMYMFYECSSLTTLGVSNWDTGEVTTMEYMFYKCTNLTTLDLSNWDKSNVTTMESMFYSCSSLTTLDISDFDTSKVTDMALMFYGCSQLTTLDISDWDTSNVTTMADMFNNCSSLTTLGVSNWDTSNVTNMLRMFNGCSSLITLDLSSFDTSNVTNMYRLFYICSSLITLDLSNFDTSNVTNMQEMFSVCSNLTTLDISNFNTSQVINMYRMFSSCSNLTTIFVSNLFDISNVSSSGSMFYNCSKLVGGNGTTYTTTHQNATYARIDGVGGKGYLTLKTNP